DLCDLEDGKPWRGDGDELCFGFEGHPERPLQVRSVTVHAGEKVVLQADLAEPFPVPAGEFGIWWWSPSSGDVGYIPGRGRGPHRAGPTTGRVRPVTHTCAGLVQFYADGAREVFYDGRDQE